MAGHDFPPSYGASAPVANPGGGVTYTVHVPDAVVPAIVGRGGIVIKEMMQQSGAQIKISQKGEYAPGTTNRIVSIIGPQQSAQFAHTLVQSKISQA